MIGLAAAATVLGYAIGLTIGLIAGYTRSRVDPLLMRTVDVMLAFPPLLFLLVLITGAGTGVGVLVIGVAAIQAPGISRIVRTATLEVSVRGYVEAAVARGERAAAVVVREVLPNILAPVLVDAGLRFTYSILIIASVNYLGLGLQPPSSDWALMISENREYISLNVWAVLAPGRDDRAAHHRREPDGRRDRAQPRPLVRAQDGPERAGVSTDGGEPVIRVENLCLGLATGEPIVQDVSFSVEVGRDPRAGRRVGSGKTTTALALLGYTRPGVVIAERHDRGRRTAGDRARRPRDAEPAGPRRLVRPAGSRRRPQPLAPGR